MFSVILFCSFVFLFSHHLRDAVIHILYTNAYYIFVSFFASDDVVNKGYIHTFCIKNTVFRIKHMDSSTMSLPFSP